MLLTPPIFAGRQGAHSDPKSASIDVSSMTAPTLGSSTTVTTVFQQPIMSPAAPLSEEPHTLHKEEEEEEEVEVEVEKKDLDEEPMEMVLEKQDEVEDAKNVSQILTKIVKATMTEDLKPMDTDKESISKTPEMSVQEDSSNDIAPMQTDEQLNKEMFVPGPNEKPLYTAEALTLEDLSLLAELFYLPYEHGPKAVQMLKEFNWLRANTSIVSVNSKCKDSEKVSVIVKKQ